jgi:uncharacterized membrane protein
MIIRKSEIAVIGIILLSVVVGICFYPQMPEKMASHWNAKGEVDSYIPKFWALFLTPLISAGLALLFLAIPRIDPLKANIDKFRKYYDGFIILFLTFLFSIDVQVILWNLGVEISPNVMLPIGVGILFFYIGILCEHSKRNWFIGIRAPWTLSSERVWDKTNKIGSKLFKIAGVITFVGAFFQKYAIFFIIIPVLVVAVYTIIYSCFEYQKEIGKC